jgi:hypothetical protein
MKQGLKDQKRLALARKETANETLLIGLNPNTVVFFASLTLGVALFLVIALIIPARLSSV